jgi:hypothetical protein
MACELTGRAAFPFSALGHALAKTGKRVEAGQVLREYLGFHKTQNACASLIYLGLGDHAAAIRSLEMGIKAREPHALLASFDPRFAPLRDQLEFRQLLGQMGLSHAVTA